MDLKTVIDDLISNAAEYDHGMPCPIRPSHSGACLRKTYLEALQTGKDGEPFDPLVQRVFRHGNDFGAWMAELLDTAHDDEDGQLAIKGQGSEIRVWHPLPDVSREEFSLAIKHMNEPDLFSWRLSDHSLFWREQSAECAVSGSIDSAIRVTEAGLPAYIKILDFKTIKHGFVKKNGGWGFKAIDESLWITCSSDYVMQLGFYCMAWINAMGTDVPLGDPALVYCSKDTQEIKVVDIPLDVALLQGQLAIDRLTEVVRAVASQEPPAREYAPPDWHCNYCRVATACWGDKIVDTTPGTRIPKWSLA